MSTCLQSVRLRSEFLAVNSTQYTAHRHNEELKVISFIGFLLNFHNITNKHSPMSHDCLEGSLTRKIGKYLFYFCLFGRRKVLLVTIIAGPPSSSKQSK